MLVVLLVFVGSWVAGLLVSRCVRCMLFKSGSLKLERKLGGKFHQRNISSRPIANKYHEGKMKRTLEREFKELERRETLQLSFGTRFGQRSGCDKQRDAIMAVAFEWQSPGTSRLTSTAWAITSRTNVGNGRPFSM